MTKRTKTVATNQHVLATTVDFHKALDRIATLGVDLDAKAADKEKEIQDVTLRHDPAISEITSEMESLMEACELYASPRKKELFGKLKSAQTSLTIYGYRLGQPTLKTLSGWTWDKVLALLEKSRRKVYIQTKKSVNKEAIRSHVPQRKLCKLGLKIEQKESFYVERKTEE